MDGIKVYVYTTVADRNTRKKELGTLVGEATTPQELNDIINKNQGAFGYFYPNGKPVPNYDEAILSLGGEVDTFSDI